MQAKTTERIFKLNAFMVDMRRQADDIVPDDMLPTKLVDDAEQMLIQGVEDSFRILFRVQEMVSIRTSKKSGGKK